MSAMSLTGHKALVTGATGGVGRAVSKRLLAEGATLLLTDRDQQTLESFADELLLLQITLCLEKDESTYFSCNLI